MAKGPAQPQSRANERSANAARVLSPIRRQVELVALLARLGVEVAPTTAPFASARTRGREKEAKGYLMRRSAASIRDTYRPVDDARGASFFGVERC